MSRRALAGWAAAFLSVLAAPSLKAQSRDGATGSPPESIDLTVSPPGQSSNEAACQHRRDAALISGEIVVCGGRDKAGPPTLYSKEERQNRYAERTMNKGTLQPPDVAGAGIFRGPATLGGICVKGVFNCPKPPALIVDVTKLPQAPPGSDADRIAHGLDPLGGDNRAGAQPAVTPGQTAELALPDPKATQAAAAAAPAANPAGSGAPKAQR